MRRSRHGRNDSWWVALGFGLGWPAARKDGCDVRHGGVRDAGVVGVCGLRVRPDVARRSSVNRELIVMLYDWRFTGTDVRYDEALSIEVGPRALSWMRDEARFGPALDSTETDGT